MMFNTQIRSQTWSDEIFVCNGKSPDLDIDSKTGHLHIVAIQNETGAVYVEMDNSGNIIRQEIIPNTENEQSKYSFGASIAVDGNGNPHVTFREPLGQHYYSSYYTYRTSAGWCSPILLSGDVLRGYVVQLDVDKNGYAHIARGSAAGDSAEPMIGPVKYFKFLNSVLQSEQDNFYRYRCDDRLEIDASYENQVHMIFGCPDYPITGGPLWYWHSLDSGAHWEGLDIHNSQALGANGTPDLFVDAAGIVHIIYGSELDQAIGGEPSVRYSRWVNQQLVRDINVTVAGEIPVRDDTPQGIGSVAASSDGNIVIVVYSEGFGMRLFVRRSDDGGATWGERFEIADQSVSDLGRDKQVIRADKSDFYLVYPTTDSIKLRYLKLTVNQPPIVDLHASIVGENILLEWSPSLVATIYNVYRDTIYNFAPDTVNGTNRIGFHISDEDPGKDGIQWTDTGNGADIVGDVNKNYFYQVTAVAAVESAPSNVAAEFDYNLTTTSGTDINEIVVIMDTKNTSMPITTAEELAQAIPNCSDVYYWDAAGQGSVGHVKGLPFNNFAISPGYPYMVNVTANTVWSLAGSYVDTSFHLITTAGTDINHLAVPLSKASLTTAELLGQDIPGCTDVYCWDAAGQGTVGHVVGLPFNNFSVRTGYPYYVNVTTATTWPTGGSLLKTNSSSPNTKVSHQSDVPHTVYGKLSFADGMAVNAKDLQIKAWIVGRPEDVLTNDKIGVGCDESYWWIGVSNFMSNWTVGDSLKVEITAADQGLLGTAIIALSDAGSDNGGVIQLSKADNDPQMTMRGLPQQFVLQPSYPNPFNAETTISYGLPSSGNVKIQIFDLSGRWIRTVVEGNMGTGYHQVTWNGRDGEGLPVSSGVYLCRMAASEYRATLKLVLIK